MRHGARALGDAQHEVVVLRAVVAVAEPADLVDEGAADDGEVAAVVLAEQADRVEVGLAEDVVVPTVWGDLVLVGVDVVDRVVLLEVLRDQLEGGRVQLVVVVEQRDEVAGREVGGVARGGDDAAVRPAVRDADAPV